MIFKILLLLIAVNQIRTNEHKVSVHTSSGKLVGRVETPVDGIKLHVYRGIPYARQPVGALRFRRPEPVQPSSKEIDASQFQKACYQNLTIFGVGHALVNKEISEDCLFLNVWTPHEKKALLPVMVWIHGGGLLVGSSSEWYYQGDVLAAKGGVVVVSINYRLNTLGFLYAGTDEAPGNVGLFDQAMALQWVKDNIHQFGGDPEKITIFGQSAGGWSVSLHTISPVSRHLFRNAMTHSGAFIHHYRNYEPKDHIKRWLKGAERIGCVDEQNGSEFTPKVMECLRSASPEDLTSIAHMVDLIPSPIKVWYQVVVDGTFLPKTPQEMLKSGDFKQNVNLMISNVRTEGSFFMSVFNDANKYDPDNPKKVTKEEAVQDLCQLTSTIDSYKPIDGQAVSKMYLGNLKDDHDYNHYLEKTGEALGDHYLTCPVSIYGKEVFRNSYFKANVYQYYFQVKFRPEVGCSKWMGVCHALDNFFTFGMPFLKSDHYNDRERQISEQMIGFLSHFAKHDKPGPQDGVEWPKFYNVDNKVIAPYYDITDWPNNVTNFKHGLKITECEYFWNKYLE